MRLLGGAVDTLRSSRANIRLVPTPSAYMIEESTSDLAAEGLHIDADELYDEAFRRYCHIARAVEGKDMSWLSLARYEKMEIGKRKINMIQHETF